MIKSSVWDKRYRLCSETQVREENFGLLFYTMIGPRLYFLSSGELLDCSFFSGGQTLGQCIEQHFGQSSISESRIMDLKRNLDQLKEKGVILEC